MTHEEAGKQIVRDLVTPLRERIAELEEAATKAADLLVCRVYTGLWCSQRDDPCTCKCCVGYRAVRRAALASSKAPAPTKETNDG